MSGRKITIDLSWCNRHLPWLFFFVAFVSGILVPLVAPHPFSTSLFIATMFFLLAALVSAVARFMSFD